MSLIDRIRKWLEPSPKLRLVAQSEADIEVFSALLQDAIFLVKTVEYDPHARALAVQCSRFLHEYGAKKSRGLKLRRECLLQINDIIGLDESEFPFMTDENFRVILALEWRSLGENCSGVLVIHFADFEPLEIAAECLDLLLFDFGAARQSRSQAQHQM